jgi:regulator of protease activity HflC (stomatin/prohibitin superfamily)
MPPAVLVLSFAAILALALMLVLSAIKIVPEYERGVVFRLGRLVGPRGPGLFFLIPIVERMVRVDTRVITPR